MWITDLGWFFFLCWCWSFLYHSFWFCLLCSLTIKKLCIWDTMNQLFLSVFIFDNSSIICVALFDFILHGSFLWAAYHLGGWFINTWDISISCDFKVGFSFFSLWWLLRDLQFYCIRTLIMLQVLDVLSETEYNK